MKNKLMSSSLKLMKDISTHGAMITTKGIAVSAIRVATMGNVPLQIGSMVAVEIMSILYADKQAKKVIDDVIEITKSVKGN